MLTAGKGKGPPGKAPAQLRAPERCFFFWFHSFHGDAAARVGRAALEHGIGVAVTTSTHNPKHPLGVEMLPGFEEQLSGSRQSGTGCRSRSTAAGSKSQRQNEMASERKGDAGDEQSWGFPITCIFSLPDHVPVRQLWKLPATGPFSGSYRGQSSQSCHGFLLRHAAGGHS